MIEIHRNDQRLEATEGASGGGSATRADPQVVRVKEHMERKLRTKQGRDIYRKRSQSVEAVFGQHATRGCDRFLLRGEAGVQAEWSLFPATHNLLKLWRSGRGPDGHEVANMITG
ncbi:transposase [Natrinema soli]|uniref:Transposase n=1 Tax=Natrinema soli TaxID=1930624 RepID=A0ABD5SUG6_9EURY